MCGKVRYPTRGAAVRARHRIDRKKGVLLELYPCRICKGWHLGNDQHTRLENMNRLFDRLPATDRAITQQVES